MAFKSTERMLLSRHLLGLLSPSENDKAEEAHGYPSP